jgi:hypothetical protein
MVAGFPLTEFDSFIIGSGKRPQLLLLGLTLAVAGGVMLVLPPARYAGMVGCAVSLFAFLAWSAWPRAFITVSSKGLKVSGRVKAREAECFLEHLQLAAEAARAGRSSEEIRAAVQTAGLNREPCLGEKGEDGEDEVYICEAPRVADQGPPPAVPPKPGPA